MSFRNASLFLSHVDVILGDSIFAFRRIMYLVGGLEHVLFSHMLGMSSSQLTFIFSEGLKPPNVPMGIDRIDPHDKNRNCWRTNMFIVKKDGEHQLLIMSTMYIATKHVCNSDNE